MCPEAWLKSGVLQTGPAAFNIPFRGQWNKDQFRKDQSENAEIGGLQSTILL